MADERNANVSNLLREVPPASREEITQVLQRAPSVRIERIISHGQSSAPGFWYDQDEHEWILLLQGHARLELDAGRIVDLAAGDCLNLPAHQRHRVDWTDPAQITIWLAVFYR